MNRIFKAEVYKITHVPSFMLSVLFALPAGVLISVIGNLDKSLTMVDVINVNLSMLVYYYVALVVIYVTNDYEKNTIKAIISSGVSKSKIYMSRLLVCVLIAEIALLFSIVGEFVYGYIAHIPMTSDTYEWTMANYAASIGFQMMFVMLVSALAYFVAIIIRKQMLSMIVAPIVFGFEPLIIHLIGKYFHIDLAVLDIPAAIEGMDSLSITGNVLIGTGLFFLIVIVVTFGIGVQVFKRRDV